MAIICAAVDILLVLFYNNYKSELCDVFEGMVSPQNESWITIPAVDGFIWYYSTVT